MIWKHILTIIAIVLFAGCTATIHHSPAASFQNSSEAKEIIKQVMLEQPGEMAPVNVEVTDQFIKIHLIKTDQMYGYNIPWCKFVHFSNIGKIEIKQKRPDSQQWFVVSVMDKDNKLKCDIYTLHESKARGFADALYTLQANKMSGNKDKNEKVSSYYRKAG